MRTIYKYDISKSGHGIIEGNIVKLLSTAEQHGTIVVWAEVDTEAPKRKFQILPIGTGWPLDPPAGEECILDSHKFLGTVMLLQGSLVFHVYYKEIIPTNIKKSTAVNEKTMKTTNNNTLHKKSKVQGTKEVNFTVSNSIINPEILKVFTN